MNKVRAFAKTSLIYFLGTVLTKLISFFLLPLYSQKLPADQFGYFDYTVTIVTIVVGTVCIELWVGAIRFLLARDGRKAKDAVVCNSLVLAGISCLLLAGIGGVLSLLLPVPYLPYVFFYGLAYLFQSLYGSFARGFGRNMDFAVSGILSGVVNMLVNVVFIGALGGGVEVLYLAFIAGAAVQVGYIEIRLRLLKSVRRENFSPALLRELLRFCMPLFINSVSYWLLSSYSKLVIGGTLGMGANGIYSMALRFSSVITLFTGVLSLAWQETVFVRRSPEEKGTLYAAGMGWCFQGMAAALILMLPAVRVLFPYVIGEEYAGALALIPLCLMNTVASGFSDFVGKVIIAENRTKGIFYSSLAGALLCVLLSTLLIRPLGLAMAPAAILAGFLVMIGIRLRLLHGVGRLAVPWKSGVLLAVLLAGALAVYYAGSVLWNLAFGAAAAGALLFAGRRPLKSLLSALLGRENRKEETT